MAKKKDNYLDYIPRPNTLFECNKNKDGKIEIKMHNKGVFNKIAQVLFKKPKYSYIELDEFGSFVWEQMDGKKTIYEIGTLVKERFVTRQNLFTRDCPSISRFCITTILSYMRIN